MPLSLPDTVTVGGTALPTPVGPALGVERWPSSSEPDADPESEPEPVPAAGPRRSATPSDALGTARRLLAGSTGMTLSAFGSTADDRVCRTAVSADRATGDGRPVEGTSAVRPGISCPVPRSTNPGSGSIPVEASRIGSSNKAAATRPPSRRPVPQKRKPTPSPRLGPGYAMGAELHVPEPPLGHSKRRKERLFRASPKDVNLFDRRRPGALRRRRATPLRGQRQAWQRRCLLRHDVEGG